MPSRRVDFREGEHYHLYNRGNNRGSVFFERENYGFFLSKWREHLSGTADTLAYCLMPNHYHFLIRLVSSQLSEAMQPFSLSYTKAVNTRFERVGALFQGRFQAIHVDEDAYLLHLSRYIHLNPVAANLVPLPEEWEFSSYREYLGLRDGTLPNVASVLQEFSGADERLRWQEARKRYRTFVESGIGKVDKSIRRWAID